MSALLSLRFCRADTGQSHTSHSFLTLCEVWVERDTLYHPFYLLIQTAELVFSTFGAILPNCGHLLKALNVRVLIIYHSEQGLVVLG